MRIIHVRKEELPLPLVVEDREGNVRILELAPAGPNKLGAFVRDAGESLRRWVKKLIGKK